MPMARKCFTDLSQRALGWYVALAAKSLDMDLETIAIQNIEKLEKRCPDGFSAEKSIHREEYNV